MVSARSARVGCVAVQVQLLVLALVLLPGPELAPVKVKVVVARQL